MNRDDLSGKTHSPKDIPPMRSVPLYGFHLTRRSQFLSGPPDQLDGNESTNNMGI